MACSENSTQEQIAAAVHDGRLSSGAAENLRTWLTNPHYAAYRERICELVAAEAFERLDQLFWEVIPFGTGGRRGLMGEFGPATINPRTIAESAHGLAVYSKRARKSETGRAVVAHDSRNRSIEFARLTATTFAANGFEVFYFESCRSTPELSFAVRHLACDVGAMISASHNPPSDNGFKAYWSSGAQVLPPHDEGIIEAVYEAAEIPTLDFDEAVREGRIKPIGEDVDRAYVDEVLALSLSSNRSIKALFTPLHGVGETSVYRVLKEAGFADIGIFEPQRPPDGNFPNVPDSLPNPERSEVFDPAIQAVAESDVELILAADPDADRLGVAVRGADGRFAHLSGNRIGVLLVDYVLRKRAAAGTLSKDHYVVETLVTTPLVAKIARGHGVRAIDDLLVGFKYIAQTMDREGPERFVFGTEESLGYLAGQYCRDKDAAIAALYLSEAAAELRAEGKTFLDRLDELYCQFGYHVEGQRSEVCPGSRGREQIKGIMKALRKEPPSELAGLTLVRVNDYLKHEVRSLPGNRRERELPEPSGDLLFFEAVSDECRVRFAARPSGTEPKIKFYLFASGSAGDAESLESRQDRIDGIMTDFSNALGEWVRSRISE